MSIHENSYLPSPGDALILVDVQKDFLPGGSLAVREGGNVIEPLNRYIELFQQQSLPVYATRDWHPQGHCSFVEQGGPWPPHCRQNSDGAEFAEDLCLPHNVTVISKGTEPEQDAYSGFDGTKLHDYLQKNGIQRLWIGGLATDVCVLNTVKDACELDYQVLLLEDSIAAVNRQEDNGAKTIETMRGYGATVITLAQVSP